MNMLIYYYYFFKWEKWFRHVRKFSQVVFKSINAISPYNKRILLTLFKFCKKSTEIRIVVFKQ